MAVVLLAFGQRLWGLNATSLWYDETFVLHYARQGMLSAVTGLLRAHGERRTPRFEPYRMGSAFHKTAAHG